MKKSASQKHLSVTKSKKLNSVQSFQKQIRSKINPILKIFSKQSEKKIQKTTKKSQQKLYLPSFCTSPTSYQNSEFISKKQSREKIKLGKKKKSNPKMKESLTFVKKNNDKFSETAKENANYLPRQKKSQGIKPYHKNRKSTMPDLQKYFNHDWHNMILKSALPPSKNLHPSKQIQKIVDLKEKLHSIEQESSSSSKNFLKFAFGQETTCEKTILVGKPRIVIIDWLFLIGASLIINRQTVHLAVHYMDGYLRAIGKIGEQMHILAAASLLLSVKQEEREKQTDLLDAICLSQKISIERREILEKQQQILIKLNFRLKSNTISFWVDYFSAKWDQNIEQKEQNHGSLLLRSSEGDSYRYYRQLIQLSDVILFFSEYSNFNKAKLALAILYLVLRIEQQDRQKPQSQIQQKQSIYINIYHRTGDQSIKTSVENHPTENQSLFVTFKRLFMQKATPIFKDPLNFNEVFNLYLTELCSFELTEIIPAIKFVSNFLDYKFSYHIDEKSFEESESYEQFIRKMSYSLGMKQYANEQIIR